MLISIDQSCSIFFGDAATCPISHKDAQFPAFCDTLRQQLELKHLVVQHQVHGVDGQFIAHDTQLEHATIVKDYIGDFLITSQPSVGISVLTADCLPVVFYAPAQRVVAVAHAGWRGTVAGICTVVLDKLTKMGVQPEDVLVYFGPAARSCCYEVQADFVRTLRDALRAPQGERENIPFVVSVVESIRTDDVLIQRDGKLFFDKTTFNKKLLLGAGVPEKNINLDYNLCTICNHQFNSYRRAEDKKNYKVQSTVVWIK